MRDACVCLSCRGDGVAIIDHPNGGRAVCNDHVGEFPVLKEVLPDV